MGRHTNKNKMAHVLSKPENINHGMMPLVNHWSEITYNYVEEKDDEFDITIPDTYTSEQFNNIQDIFSSIYEAVYENLPDDWSDLNKWRVLVDCAVKMNMMMN